MNKKKYIFESPDKGKTIYRREFGVYDAKRELVDTKGEIEHSKYYYEFDRNTAPVSKADRSNDIEFKAIIETLQEAKQWDLIVEVIWSSLKAMKKSKGSISILTALQQGKNEWDI